MNREEIIERLREEDSGKLFREADQVRKVYCGDEVHLRGIIEFSNCCWRSCLYCGLRRENKKILRYRMPPDEIIELASRIVESEVRTIVLQSGDDFRYNRKMLSIIISRIKKENPGIALTLSLGERPLADYKAWKDAGADRYLLKHETANPRLYERLHPGQTLKERLKILAYLRRLDYQVGAGNIVGLPGQSLRDLADDILLMKNLEVDMAGIGPFIPQKDTPLGIYPSGNLDLTLKVLALTRIVTQNTHLPATTALSTLNPAQGQIMALKAGANVIMPDFTPEQERKNYIIYDNKTRVDLERAKELISKVQRLISQNRGDSLKWKRHQRAFAST